MLQNNSTFNTNAKKSIAIIAGILLIIIISLIIFTSVTLSGNKIYKGTYIEGINVSGLTAEEAAEVVNSKMADSYQNKTAMVKYEDTQWKINSKDINLRYSVDDVVNRAYAIGRQGNVMNRMYSILSLRANPAEIHVKLTYDRDKLRNIFENIKAQVDKVPMNATIEYKGSKVNINPDTPGKSVNIDANVIAFDSEIETKRFGDINLNVETIRPDTIFDDIKDIDSVLGYTSTKFNANDTNRTYNIKLACEKINGIILKPGELFSMNNALGPRTIANGYKDAKVIYMNELVDGPGGGVCQVTTTLYGSVLKSGTKVVERMPHSMPLGYVEPGQDATIAENYIDFKFKNSKDYPIALAAEVSGNNLYIRVLGKKDENDYVVKLKSVVIEEYKPEKEEIIVDNSLPDNERFVAREPKTGLKVRVYREIYNKSGQLLDKEKISEDIYKPVRAQVKVNQYIYDAYYNSKS